MATGNVKSEYIEITGLVENTRMFDRLLTTDESMSKNINKLIKDLLKTARKKLTNDAKSYIKNDPRKAARAVKFAVYKTVFGGNLSILSKKRAGARYELIRQRKLDQNPNQRGGNRRPRSQRTKQLDTYFGADRGFVLRFLNAGTAQRQTRFGNRGAISPTWLFSNTAQIHMETAAEILADAINEYISRESQK
jgi:hypothetical protein